MGVVSYSKNLLLSASALSPFSPTIFGCTWPHASHPSRYRDDKCLEQEAQHVLDPNLCFSAAILKQRQCQLEKPRFRKGLSMEWPFNLSVLLECIANFC